MFLHDVGTCRDNTKLREIIMLCKMRILWESGAGIEKSTPSPMTNPKLQQLCLQATVKYCVIAYY